MKNKIIGSPGKIVVTEDASGNLIIDIDPTYGGQVSINTTGTLNVSRYAGEIVQPQYGGTGVNNKGALLVAADSAITGSLTLDCPPDSQTTLKINRSGTVALQEENLKINNCFAEFTEEQKTGAFNNISPLKKAGSILMHNGIDNVELEMGQLNQYLGVNSNSKTPSYITPEFYSDVNDMPRRRRLVFHDKNFYLRDSNEKGGETIVHLKPMLKQFLNLDAGLHVIKQQNNKKFNDGGHCFEPRKLVAGRHIKIHNANFIKGNPVIELADSFYKSTEINTLGTVKIGEWEAQTIQPQYGGTGYPNKHTIQIQGDVYFDAPFSIRSSSIQVNNHGLTIQIKGTSKVDMPLSGTLATVENSLQKHCNLKDIPSPKEAFRHISPTNKKGDLIIRGERDYDEALELSQNEDHILVSSLDSQFGLEYKHPKYIKTLVEFISTVFEDKIQKTNERYEKLLERCLSYENTICKKIDILYAQFDALAKNKQFHIIKDLQNELKIWKDDKIKQTK